MRLSFDWFGFRMYDMGTVQHALVRLSTRAELQSLQRWWWRGGSSARLQHVSHS